MPIVDDDLAKNYYLIAAILGLALFALVLKLMGQL